jgi:adenylate cyclase
MSLHASKPWAEPGGICVSWLVRDQVRDKLSFSFEDQGEHQVKNIARPIRVRRVVLGERPGSLEPTAGTSMKPSLTLPDKPLTAVLAFLRSCRATLRRNISPMAD